MNPTATPLPLPAASLRSFHAAALLRHPPLEAAGRTVRGALLAWQVTRVLAHIDSRLESGISIEDLAAIARVSPSHFCRAFRRSLSVSPHAFIMRRRIERSQELMLASAEPLSHIAFECGFADQAHFSRVHRNIVGVAPGVWRRMWQDGASDR